MQQHHRFRGMAAYPIHISTNACMNWTALGWLKYKNLQQLVWEWQLNFLCYSSAVCSPSCANGGTCVSPNTCACQSGWTGSICSQRELRFPFLLPYFGWMLLVPKLAGYSILHTNMKQSFCYVLECNKLVKVVEKAKVTKSNLHSFWYRCCFRHLICTSEIWSRSLLPCLSYWRLK